MGKRIIRVTPVQVAAARLKVKCDEKLGRETEPAVLAIANARRRESVDDDDD